MNSPLECKWNFSRAAEIVGVKGLDALEKGAAFAGEVLKITPLHAYSSYGGKIKNFIAAFRWIPSTNKWVNENPSATPLADKLRIRWDSKITYCHSIADFFTRSCEALDYWRIGSFGPIARLGQRLGQISLFQPVVNLGFVGVKDVFAPVALLVPATWTARILKAEWNSKNFSWLGASFRLASITEKCIKAGLAITGGNVCRLNYSRHPMFQRCVVAAKALGAYSVCGSLLYAAYQAEAKAAKPKS